MRIPYGSLAALLITAGSLSAEPVSPDWGVTGRSSYVLNAWDMQVTNSGVTWAILPNTNRYLTSGGGGLIGEIHVPQGALITTIELDACDDSVTGGVHAFFLRSDAISPVLLAEAHTDFAGTPGCTHVAADLATPETVDNAYRYVVTANNESLDASTSVGAIRVFYRLQTSPAPAQPTFNDVPPSDPAYQYIEALVSSGVTAGCGGGNYCPDAPLTRRQMAVFLSKALGLDWPTAPAP